MYRGLGGPRADVDGTKISPPLASDAMILQPIASPFTDYTSPVAFYMHLMQQNYIGVSTVKKRDRKLLPSIITREIIVLRPWPIRLSSHRIK
jgi:hypothetical protein